MDRDILHSLIYRLWSLVSGFGSLFLIPLYLDSTSQGFYFAFLSIVGLQVFFELGLGQVLLFKFSFSKDESSAALTQEAQGQKDPTLFSELVYSARVVYRTLALLFWVVILPFGYSYFDSSATATVQDWRLPWLVLISSTSFNLLQSVKFVFLEAVGQVSSVAQFRLITSVASTALFATLLANGLGLWCVTCSPLCTSLTSCIWLKYSRKANEYRSLRKLKPIANLRVYSIWSQAVWPLQWQSSISWASGYFIYQFLTPFVFSKFGPVQAGRFGFVNTLLSSGVIVCSTFTAAISPRLAALFRDKEYSEMNRLFSSSLKQSLFALISLALGVNLLAPVLSRLPISLFRQVSARLLDPISILMLSISSVFIGLIYCLSLYLRSQQKEPLLIFSIIQAIVVLSAIWLGSFFDLLFVCSAYCITNMIFFLWCYNIYLKSRILLSHGA